MAEGFEHYHVPQQSRREKLRFLPGQTHPVCVEPGPHLFHGCAASFYDPTSTSLISSSSELVKEEGHVNLMGFINSSATSLSLHNFRHPYMDPQPSNFAPNPNSVHDINNLFLYPNQQNHQQHHNHLREFHDDVLFKPEPLSLSLSSQPVQVNNLQQRYGYSGNNDGDHGSRSPGPSPLGPFTGYASILKGSRFLKPAQQLLEEFCDVGGSSRDIYTAVSRIMTDDSSSFLEDPPIESFDDPVSVGSGDGGESRRKKSRLISMLDEVYRRYKQYHHQMQAVVTSFEYVAGLGNAAPYANLAIKAMTRHFKSLKNAITDQLQSRSSRDTTTYLSRDKDEAIPMLLNSTRGIYSQHRSFHNTEVGEHQPVWRPQRGLPERAVTVLRSWLFEHFLHPYPTDTDKIMLAKQTGLSRSQVSNWFINARVRLWKPMVEEIHMLETRQAHIASQRSGDQNADRSNDHDHLPSATSVASENPSTSTRRAQDTASKRARNEYPDVTVASSHEQLNLSCNNLPSHIHHVGHVGASMAGGSTSGVSLTLGLHHQNNGIGLSEPPYAIINTAQRFGLGLDGNSDGYGMGGFDAQNRHFGRDVMGGQLLHDFVG